MIITGSIILTVIFLGLAGLAALAWWLFPPQRDEQREHDPK